MSEIIYIDKTYILLLTMLSMFIIGLFTGYLFGENIAKEKIKKSINYTLSKEFIDSMNMAIINKKENNKYLDEIALILMEKNKTDSLMISEIEKVIKIHLKEKLGENN